MLKQNRENGFESTRYTLLIEIVASKTFEKTLKRSSFKIRPKRYFIDKTRIVEDLIIFVPKSITRIKVTEK